GSASHPSSQPSCGLCHLSVGTRMRRSFRRFAADAQHPADRRAQFLVLAVDAAKPTTRPPLPLQQLGLQSLDVLAPRFCFLRPEHPADPFIAVRGVRSSHAARTFGLAIRTRLKSTGTVCTTPPEIALELIDRPSYLRSGRR